MLNYNIDRLQHTESGNFFIIAGPCVVEGSEITFSIAREIKSICNRLGIPFIFKGSYRKANRSRLDSFTGIGDREALGVLAGIRSDLNIPVLTDIHSAGEAEMASAYVDILQIPAFLCRQTDLLIAASKTGKVVNVKKGQFLSPGSMKFAIEKIESTGNQRIMLTERGTMFGYQDLVVDFRGIPEMQKEGYPVVLDVTHSLQQPNQVAGVTGGIPSQIGTIASAGIAVGVDGIFLETHPEPADAKSDGANMLRLDMLEELLNRLLAIHKSIV